MAASGSKVAIFAAIAGNFAIAVTKFVASAMTGSSAMLTEGIHSLVDTGNGGLLLIGIARAKRPPDEKHPFGYGQELYFWTLIVAVLIFGLGGGISIYEGILHVLHPVEISDPTVNYIVLGLAIFFEGMSCWVALKGFMHEKGENSFYHAIRNSKDPTTFTVLFEDLAAMAGLVIALIGISLGHWLEIPQIDGVASILIGTLLCIVAMVLMYETHSLMIGEAADEAILQSVRQIAEEEPSVDEIRRPVTVHFGPHHVLLALEIQFNDKLLSDQIEETIDRLEATIRSQHPDIKQIYIEAESITTAIKKQAKG